MHLRLKNISAGLLLLVGQSVFASGYEIPIMLGGRAAGLAGIATPYAQGSEALYFNPAGLAREKMASDITLFGSPIQSKFSQPGFKSEDKFSSPFGLMYAMSINEDFGFGIGAYTSAGSKVDYKDVTSTTALGTAKGLDEKTDLSILEIAGGVGYRVNDRLKLGASYRVIMAQAEFKTIRPVPVTGGIATANVGVKDLKDTEPNGFKLGGQYRLGEKTLLGLTYRSPIFLEAKGKYYGKAYAGPLSPSIVENNVTAKTVLPEQVTLGVSSELWDHWNIMGEYSWTQYSRVKSIAIKGDLAVTGLGTLSKSSEVIQNWRDQHVARVGAEYVGYKYPIRFGYDWTSQVTDESYARGTFAPPSSVHNVAVGTGAWLATGLKLDGAFNYTFGKGDSEAPVKAAGIREGKFDVNSYQVNLALMYAY